MKGPVNEGSGDHETRIQGSTDDPAEWIPALGIEPVPKFVKALLSQILSNSVIEVGIKLVDHALVTKHTEQTGNERQNVNQEED